MKKVDEVTGMIIEVPNSTAIRSKFPYPGFWSAVYPNLSRAISQYALPSTSRADIDNALAMLIELMNGEQAVILTERIYYIGEVLDLNYTLPVEGRAGSALGFVQASADGGRMAVAARLFTVPIKAIIAQSAGKTTSNQSMGSLLNEQASYKQELERLTIQLRQLEQGASSKSALHQMGVDIQQMQNETVRIANEIQTREAQIIEMSKLRQEYARVKNQFDADAKEINQLRGQINNSSSNEIRRASTAALAPVLKRYENAGVWLNKTALQSSDATLKDLQRLQQIQGAELARVENELVKARNAFEQASANYQNSVVKGQGVWIEMQKVSNHLQSMEANLANASNAMSSFSNLESSKLTRVWVAHLAECRTEVEALLFKAKANEMGAITGSPTPMLAEPLVDPSTVKDFEEYIDALNMIGDALDNEEYGLVEEIGRLGLSMAYVPGAARVLALAELSKSKRIVAYRNLVEEILSQGQKLDADSQRAMFSIPGFGLNFVFEDDSDLAEVKELLRHLTDSRLNFKYGGGV